MRLKKRIFEALFNLSRLGRLQVAILLLNALAPFLAINGRIGFSDPLYLLLGLEFVAFNVFGIIYTLAAENHFSFYSLIFMQIQLVAYVVASSAVGVLSRASAWMRWGIVIFCLLAFLTFIVLQRALRRSWGWHAYSMAGANPEHLQLYRHYQFLSASTTVDAFYAIFFSTVQMFLHSAFVWSQSVCLVVCLATVVLARPLQLSIRREKIIPVSGILLCYIVGFAAYVYFAVVNFNRLAAGVPLNRSDRNGSFNTLGEQYVVVALEASGVLIRLVSITAIANSTSIFGKGLATFFPKSEEMDDGSSDGGGGGGGYLINPADHIRQPSRITTGTVGDNNESFANTLRTGAKQQQTLNGATTTLETPFISSPSVITASATGLGGLQNLEGGGGGPISVDGALGSGPIDRSSLLKIVANNQLGDGVAVGGNLGGGSAAVFIDATAQSSSVAQRPTARVQKK